MEELAISKRITIRRIRQTDAESIFGIIDSQREYLGKWLPFVHHTTEAADSKAFVDSVLDIPGERLNAHVFAILYDGVFAGLAGIQYIDAENLKAEIGYWLNKHLQGKGIITQCVTAMCEYGFKELGLNRIAIRCAVDNVKSSAIPKRLGFLFEGIEREGERLADGSFHDLEIYGMLKREWKHLQRPKTGFYI